MSLTITDLATGKPFAAVLSPFTGPREFFYRGYSVLLSYRRERTEAQYVADGLTPLGRLMPRVFAATEDDVRRRMCEAIDAIESLPADAGPPAVCGGRVQRAAAAGE